MIHGALRKDLHFTSFCQALVDVVYPVTFEELDSWQLPKGTWKMLSSDERQALLQNVADRTPSIAPGGALANTTLGMAKLGAKTAFLSAIGADSFGDKFIDDFRNAAVYVGNESKKDGETGVCLCFVTPDGERTMRTNLGRAGRLLAADLDPDLIDRSEWMGISSYLLCQEGGADLVEQAIALAQASKTKIAFTLGDRAVIAAHRETLLTILPKVQMAIGNIHEAATLVGREGKAEVLKEFFGLVSLPVVTTGASGCWIKEENEPVLIPAEACTPVDLTGAGDTFMAGFLFAIIQGCSDREAAARGARLSRYAISHPEGRWGIDYSAVWNSFGTNTYRGRGHRPTVITTSLPL